MSIEAKMKGVIKSRNTNFYDRFNEYTLNNDVYSDDPTSPYFGYTAAEILEAKNAGESVPTTVLEWAYEQSESLFTPTGDPDFDNMITGFDSAGNPIYNPDIYKTYNQKTARYKALKLRIDGNANRFYTDDESSRFYGLTYEEILGLADQGETIPDEILNWATEMANTAPADHTETPETSDDAKALYLSLKNNPSLNIKSIAVIFTKKCESKDREIEAYLDELEPIEKEMETASVEAETKKQEALNEIKTLVEEWKTLQRKLDNGEELSDEDSYRMEEIQGLFGAADKRFQKEIDKTTKNFTEILSRLNITSSKATSALDFGVQTVDVAKELAEYERTHKRSGRIYGGLIGAGLIDIFEAMSISGNKNYSKTAHTVGINTQNFALGLQTTINEVHTLMQNTANTAGFDLEDPTYTVEPLTNDDSIDEPSLKTRSKKSNSETNAPDATNTVDENPVPAAAEGTGETVDNAENAAAAEEEQSDENLMQGGEQSLVDVDAKTLSLPKLKRLVQLEGEDSEKKGQDALKLVEQLKTQSATVDEKEQQVQEDTANVKETSENTEGSDNEGNLEEAQTAAETSQADLEAATEEESLTVEGLRETFEISTKANKKYSKDVKEADKTMKENIYTGSFTIAGGGYMTGVGIFNIVTGTSLLSSVGWWNPVVAALATYLINVGSAEIVLGSAMIAGGTALTVSAAEGLKIDDETREKIGISNEDISTASESLDEIERQQMEEVDGEQNGTESPEENENTDEPTEEDKLSEDKSLLEKMYTGNDILPEMRSLALSDGKTSSAIGKENVEKLTGLERQIPSLIEATIEFEQTKQAGAAESADAESEDATTDVQDPAEVYEEYRQDYKADLEQNKEFKQDIKETSSEAKTNLGYATLGTTAGTARVALGASEIAIGTVLASQWWNPVAMMLGLALIKKGTEDTALGSEMLAIGLALTVNSTTTLVASGIASSQVSESNDKTNDSLNTVDAIEAEINAAVQAQLAATGEQDLSGMSVIELLTLIINNGIKSSVLGTENTELIEALKGQLPQLIENAKTKAQQTEEDSTENTGNAVAANTANPTEAENNEESGNSEEDSEEKESIFTQYQNDFKTDLETNEQYSSEINQAKSISPILNKSFFLGAPVEKANNKIEISNQQTTTALDEVESMEEQVEEEVEAAQEAQEEQPGASEDEEQVEEGSNDTEYDEEGAFIPEYNCVKVKFGKVTHCETAPAEITQDEDAEDEEKDYAKEEKKLDKKVQKEDKKQDKLEKEQITSDKEIENTNKEIENTEQEIIDSKEEANENEEQGLAAQEEAPTDEAETSGSEAETQQNETTALSSEVTDLATEMQEVSETTKAEVQAATAENQGIVTEMNILNSGLQQDQNKMRTLNNQIKQEGQKSKAADKSQKPAAPKPQPMAAPAAKPKKVNQKPKQEKPEDTEEPAQTPAPAQVPAQSAAPTATPDSEPTVMDAPEGANKVQFASEKEKPADFVGFVAQSDSLASGSVQADSTAQTNNQNGQNTSGGAGIFALTGKTQQKKKSQSKQKKQSTSQAPQATQEDEAPKIIASNRSTQRPFDINSMQGGAGGNGSDKTQRLRTSMQAVRTAAFNKQAKLNAMQIRANNNVMENIQKEAFAQAEAARKQRLAQEKQERIAKIKQYASYVQMVGGLATTTGSIVQWCGTGAIAKGTKTILSGAQKIVQGVQGVATATGKEVSGTATITAGTTQITIGTTQEATGAAEVVTGTATIGTGSATLTAGTITAATGASLAAGVFTAPASPPPIAAGAVTIASGTATIATGGALEATGAILEATGLVEQGTGTTTVSQGTITVGEAAVEIGKFTEKITEGTADVLEGNNKIVSGAQLVTTGSTIQAIGTYTTAAGAALSAGADIANGNILGGIASIVGAAASCVGINTNLSALGQAAVQLGSQGVALAGQLTTMNAGQDNGGQQQNQKKKKQFKENANTQKIIVKTQNRRQAVGNRFNK